MQPLTRIGLVRLVVFLACASVVALAQDRYGCAVSQKCPADPGFAGGRLKCQRCQSDLLHLMNDERLNAETENKPMCQSMVRDNYDGGNYNYYDVSGDDDLAKCFTPGFLLYDGAFECFAFRQGGAGGTILAALEKCIGAAVGFYGCLCNKGINDDHVRSLTPCFGRGQVPIMERICPPRQIKRFPPRFAQQLPANKGPKPQLGQNRRKGNRRSTGGPSDSSRDDSTVGTDVAPHQDSDETYSDGSDGDYFVDDWPPSLSDQFSPVLKDTGVSFYLDIWERVVLVNTTTLEVIYYEPYYLYRALSYDKVLQVQGNDKVKLVRRCWLYPYSDRVWCYQWYMTTAELAEYGYTDSDTETILGPSAAATITASTGDTTVPTAYTSVTYTTAGSIPSAATRKASDVTVTTASQSSTAKPSKGSSSAPAFRPRAKSWLSGFLLIVLMYIEL